MTLNEFRADMHCHSTCSDGTCSPIEMVHLAKEKGLSGLSITDHDTIHAYSSAIQEAEKSDLQLISGVEFSSNHKDISVHILCYSFHPQNPLIVDFCQRHQQRRENRNLAILERLKAQNMPLSLAEVHNVSAHHSLTHTTGRPHIAQAMVKKGYVESMKDAFRLYLGEDKSCYVPGNTFSAEETLDVIHQAKGLAILAHPHLIKSYKITQELLTLNFDGLEAYYGRFQPEQNKKWVSTAKKKNWLITGGSDFHGDNTPTIYLGNSWIDKDHFLILQQHYKNNVH